METKITRASNGRGIAAQSTVEIIRAPGNMILDVTSTQNFPGVNEDNTVSGEIFHFGCWSADGGGVLVPGTLVEGKAHVSNIGEVTIDSLDPGFTDKGNNIGDIFMVKPTTGWANDMVEALQATLNPDGTLKDNSVTADKVDFTTGVWWEELGRATNSVASTANLVVSIPVEKRRKYYKIIVAFERATTGSVTYPMVQINNDGSSNYQTRAIISSIASGTGLENQRATITNVGEVELTASVGAGGRIEVEISRALHNGWYPFFCHCASDTYVKTGGGRWQSSAPITSFRFAPNGANMTAGTEIVVLGHN